MERNPTGEKRDIPVLAEQKSVEPTPAKRPNDQKVTSQEKSQDLTERKKRNERQGQKSARMWSQDQIPVLSPQLLKKSDLDLEKLLAKHRDTTFE